MSCGLNTHNLRTDPITGARTFVDLGTGLEEIDSATIARLNSLVDGSDANQCEDRSTECVESQEWTYGLDNTGTTFTDTASYELTLSDGSVLEFDQTPTGGWSQQLTLWAANIQAAANAAGLQWFVEPRFIDTYNPSNLDGTINGPGGTPSGLPGAPSLPVALALHPAMAWRYINFQIAPGQPVPVDAKRIISTTYGDTPFTLTTAGAVLGPISKFQRCVSCGEEPTWYLQDGVTLADPGEIPEFWQPCGTLALIPPPPDRDCEFLISVACDNNNSANTVDFTNTITRRATVCSGEQIAVDFFQADPLDPGALVPYTIVGDFVDCATGVPIEEPEAPCEDFALTKAFRLTGINGQLRSRQWHDTNPSTGTGSGLAEGQAHRNAHDFSLVPDSDINVTSLVLDDIDNTAAELDIQVIDGFIKLDQPVLARYTSSSEGYWAVELGACGGPMTDLAESGGFFNGREMVFPLPKGVHQIRLWNIDSGGSNSAATFGYSTDGGATWINDNTPPGIELSTQQPTEECLTVKVCKDTGLLFDLLTGEALLESELTSCPCTCEPCCGGGGEEGSGSSLSAQDIADAIEAIPEVDVPLTRVSGTGSVPAGLKSVTINNLTGITTINGGFQLGTGRRVDSISFGTDRGNKVNELLPAYTLAGGTWQWIGHTE